MQKLKNILQMIRSELKDLDPQRRKQLISALTAAAVVIGLAALPGLAADNVEEDGPQSVIYSGEVTTGSITSQLRGGGTLIGADPEYIRLPDGVKLTEFLVENYSTVQKGDALARVDKVSVMTAISAVQDQLDELADAMNDADTGTGTATVESKSKGTVKAVYAAKGDDVQTVMAEHGALAVISIDGLMAVEVETGKKFSSGDRVWVALEDGTEVAGTVESYLNETLTVTVEDDGYAIGAAVTVTDSDDKKLGTGTLYVHQSWNAVAYSGTVSAVNIKENGSVTAGKTLFSLKNVDQSGTFEALNQQRLAYEELQLELFVMYQSGALLAPCDGMVSGVDKNSAYLLSAEGTYEISLLANEPDGTNGTVSYTNYVGYVTAVGVNDWSVSINSSAFQISDYYDTSWVNQDTATMTDPQTVAKSVPVYERSGEGWVQVPLENVAVGDVLIFAGDTTGLVWAVRVAQAAVTPEGGDGSGDGTQSGPLPGGDASGNMSGMGGGASGGGMPMGGSSSGYSGMGQTEESTTIEAAGTNVLAVTPLTEMTMEILVDEQDITKVYLGQTGDVQIDVLHGQLFTGTVTEIGTTGTSDGGNAKYTVEITLPWTEGMLSGMSGTVSFTLGSTDNVPVIPVAALVDNGSETVVYTRKSGEELKKPVTVTTGVSDGENVEILSGLEEGKTFYYSVYEGETLK